MVTPVPGLLEEGAGYSPRTRLLSLPQQESFIQRLNKMCKICPVGTQCYSVTSGPCPVPMGLHSRKPHGHFSHAVGPHTAPPGLRLCGRESLQKPVSSSLCPVFGGGAQEVGAFRGVWGYTPRSSACPPGIPSPHLGLAFPWTLLHAPAHPTLQNVT